MDFFENNPLGQFLAYGGPTAQAKRQATHLTNEQIRLLQAQQGMAHDSNNNLAKGLEVLGKYDPQRNAALADTQNRGDFPGSERSMAMPTAEQQMQNRNPENALKFLGQNQQYPELAGIVGQHVAGQAFPEQQDPTAMIQNMEYLLGKGIGGNNLETALASQGQSQGSNGSPFGYGDAAEDGLETGFGVTPPDANQLFSMAQKSGLTKQQAIEKVGERYDPRDPFKQITLQTAADAVYGDGTQTVHGDGTKATAQPNESDGQSDYAKKKEMQDTANKVADTIKAAKVAGTISKFANENGDIDVEALARIAGADPALVDAVLTSLASK